MVKQEILEKAFAERDFSTIRTLQFDQDVDYSFQNNIMLKTIISENLHIRYFKVILNRTECDFVSILPELLILSAQHNNEHLILELGKHFNADILINLDFDFFLKICETNNHYAIDYIFNATYWFVLYKKISMEKLLDFLKNGLIYIINHLPIYSYTQLKHFALSHPFDNFILIRTVLNLPESSKRDFLLHIIGESSQDFLASDFIIDVDFVKQYSKGNSDYNKLRNFCFNSVNSFLDYNTINEKDNQKLTKYNEKIPFIYKMTSHFNNFYIIHTDLFLHSIILKKNNDNSFIMNLIKDYGQFTETLISATFTSFNYHLFEDIFNYFKLNKATFDFSLLNLFQIRTCFYESDDIEYKSIIIKLFIDKILESNNEQLFIYDASNILDLLRKSSFITLHIFNSKPDIFNLFKKENNLLLLYKEASRSQNQLVFNYLIKEKILFNYIDLQLLLDNIEFLDQSQAHKLQQSVKLHYF